VLHPHPLLLRVWRYAGGGGGRVFCVQPVQRCERAFNRFGGACRCSPGGGRVAHPRLAKFSRFFFLIIFSGNAQARKLRNERFFSMAMMFLEMKYFGFQQIIVAVNLSTYLHLVTIIDGKQE